jgi:hypothetical protein
VKRGCSRFLPCLLLTAAACQSVATVDRTAPSAVATDHALRVRVDNDSIGLGDSTDRGYTNGIEFEWTPPMRDPNRGLARQVRALPLMPQGADAPHVALYFGQQMFTPEDIQQSALIPDDRPYAGWLYGGIAARNVQLDHSAGREDRFDEWRLDIGIVGPSSAADTVQIEWHEIIRSPRPNGWRHQLRDEPGFLLGYRRAHRSHHYAFSEHLAGDVLVDASSRLGNVRTDVGLGVAVRLGFGLPRDFGTAARIVERGFDAEGRPTFARVGSGWSAHAIAGVRGDVVLHDIFLDGNTWKDSHDVDRNWFVADVYAGVEVRCTEHVRLSYTHVLRTPEFESGIIQGETQDFASIELMLGF